MTARSFSRGFPIEFNKEKEMWVYSGTENVVDHLHYCSRCGRSPEILNINNRDRDVDSCIANKVIALNAAGLKTRASCCGHGRRPGNVALEDGREIFIISNFEEARKLDKLWPPLNMRNTVQRNICPEDYEMLHGTIDR